MTRTFVRLPYFRAQTDWANDEAGHEAWVLSVRDKLRADLDPDDFHTNWLIGDVAKWPTTYVGYGFSIQHMSGGTPTGPEWAFFFPGSWSSGLVDIDDILQPTRTLEYFRDSINGTSDSLNGVHAFHYSPVGGYDFGYDADGALTGGDLSAPNTNPNSDLDTFMPALNDIYGIIPTALGGVGAPLYNWGFLFDDSKPFAVLYASPVGYATPGVIWLSGESIETNVVADSDVSVSASWALTTSLEATAVWAYAYDDVGTRTNFSISTPQNLKYPDGTAPWNKALLYSSAYVKGWFDPDVIRVVGQYRAGFGQIFQAGSNVYFKGTDTLGLPWVPSVPVFPRDEVISDD